MGQPEQNKSVDHLLGKPVFDYQPDGPQLMSDHLYSVMEDALEQGINGEVVYYDILRTERARQFRDDPEFRQRLREVWAKSGVTALAPTLVSVKYDDPLGWNAVVDDLRRWQVYIDSADWLSKVRSPEDLLSEDMSILYTVQNTTALEGDLSRIDELHDWGIQIVQLTYNRSNRVGDGCYEDSDNGLTEFGVDVIKRLNALDMAVDLSHCGPNTTIEGIKTSQSPPCLSHSFAKELNDHPRGATDEQLQALADANGYVGVVTLTRFLGRSRDLEAMIDHIDHLVDIVGVDRVGIGTDWGGGAPEVPNELYDDIQEFFASDMGATTNTAETASYGTGLPPMTAFTEWTEIPRALADRGYTDSEIRGICGENFLEYYRRVTN